MSLLSSTRMCLGPEPGGVSVKAGSPSTTVPVSVTYSLKELGMGDILDYFTFTSVKT